MPVFRWGQPWVPFHELEREVDRLLATVSLSLQQGVRFGRQFPAVNLFEVDQELLLTAELPGVRPEDLEVTVADGILTLKGRRTGPPDIPDDRFRRQERLRGAWQRSLQLPERVLEEQLSAEFLNGVLKIRLPRAPVSQPRQIKVVDANAEPNG
ncbi:MAG TPA: Hsp20/alpha crystallin family protein [Planctomycetaceae bacterium]|nr:Hsp20/alpha crystallin family protein [Planctomycetaceae bacterium]